MPREAWPPAGAAGGRGGPSPSARGSDPATRLVTAPTPGSYLPLLLGAAPNHASAFWAASPGAETRNSKTRGSDSRAHAAGT